MKKIKVTALFLAAVMMAGICAGCSSKSEKKNDIFAIGKPGSCGLMLRDSKEGFTIFESGSATDVVTNEDGSVSWIATAAGGAGGGVSFYAKSSKEEINIANYKSIELEFAYEPVAGRWNAGAQNPGFCLRILPYDSTGLFGGFEDLEYFDSSELSGTIKYTVNIPEGFENRIIASSDFDSILGFALKFNDYNRGNSNGDQLKVQLKNVKFNAKDNAPKDSPFDDGLSPADYGTVVSINYPTHDYTVPPANWTDADSYEKHAWVYLPAGYDATDISKKYPVFILLHGFGQNENTWGLTDQGRGGKIKGYMDRGMKTGNVEKFILVVPTGVASKQWGPNGAGNDFNGFNAFAGELRDDLLPYIRENFNVKPGRDNVALAGLSMGGGQTFSIGIAQCLDLISNFAGFSGALFTNPDTFITGVDGNKDFKGLKIHNLYLTCGDNDFLVYNPNPQNGMPGYQEYVEAIKNWSRIENFNEYTFPGGTHDFPVWYHGFKDFIQIVCKKGVQLYAARP